VNLERFERSRSTGLYVPREKRIAAPPPPPPPVGLSAGVHQVFPASGPPVSGASLWLNAPNVANSNATWLDQSGNSNNATITNSGGTLALATGINGLQCYRGSDGGNQSYAATPTYATTVAFTAYAVYQLSAAGTTHGRQGLISANYATEYILMTSFGSGSGSGIFGYVNGSPATLVGSNLDANPHIGAVVYPDPAVMRQSSWYLDGALWTTGNILPPTAGSQIRYIGNWEGVLNLCINGWIGEIIEYPFAHSAAQVTSTFAYLGAKWGIAV
jgi:hypothetical protein